MRTYPVIVGADGTESSKAAVRWAAREAQRRGLPLRVTHVFDWEWREARYDVGNDCLDLARKQAEGIVGNAVYEARLVAPKLEIEGDPIIGHAASRLLTEAADAALIVVGHRGRGSFGSLLLGSVSRRVAIHAPSPAVVVRGREEVTDGPVVVGVDDSPLAELVLQTAFEAAAGRGCPLLVIRSYLPAIPLWLANVPAAAVDTPEADAQEFAQLDEQLAPWRERHPEVPVEVLLTHVGAASALVEASAKAQLVIVGNRGHGVVTGTLLGSAGLELIHHADCPVYICRPPVRSAQ